jgi:glycosyltransferase involved in cell wall biosynthesis
MRVVRALRLARRVGKYDIVTAQDPFENGFVAWRAARRRHAKLHVQVHTDPFNAGYASHSLINFVRLYIALFVLKRADGIRVVSDRIKTSIEKRLKPKRTIAILPIYVDVRRIREAQLSPDLSQRFAKFSTKLLLVSRLEKEKNPALALRAFARAAPADACLMILGEGRLRLHLIAEARKLRITERVFFEGTKDVAPYYKLADLVLVPSKYEGYGRVFIEASAAGRPILSTDVGIAREVGAIIADEQHFAEALKRWFENGPRTSELTSYPYTSFDEYLREYCFDIVSLV